MKTIRLEKDIQHVNFGEQLDLGQAFPVYYSDRGTTNGKPYGQKVYWTLRRDADSILEEEIIFDRQGTTIIGTTIHDKGLSGNYDKLDAWLKGIEKRRAA